MKKIKLLIAVLFAATSLQAQWVQGTGEVHTTNLTDKVGIGISSPQGNLQVNGVSEASSSTTLNGNLILSSTSMTSLVNSFGIHASSTNPYSWIQSRHLSFSNTYPLSLNPRGGNVGIGETNPQGKLHISGKSEASSATVLNGSLILSGAPVTGLVNSFGIDASTIPYSWIQSRHLTNGNTFNLALNPRGGNIGIGIVAPITKLHVQDLGAGGTADGASPTNGLLIGGSGTAGVLNIGINATGAFHSWIQSRQINSATFYNLALNPHGGNVGIGTTAPAHKLDVKGTIHAEEVIVNLTVEGPDYVFEEGYNLQNLTELDQYLKANKHLPEVPSAAQMKAEGINMVEMQMLLLKKVEELTLHLLEMNEENKNQQQEIELLKTKIN
jgi:hypothetical protein